MIRASVVTLIKTLPDPVGVYEAPPIVETELYCDVESVKRSEFYEARNHGLKPEWVLVLSDYADYDGQTVCKFEGAYYNIIRTYTRNDHAIELTIERANNYDDLQRSN